MATLQSIPSQPTSLVSNPPDNPDRITLDHCLAISFVSSLLATAIISTTWEALKAAYTACRGWIPELKFFDKRNGTEEDNGEERELAMRVREKGESGGRDETERKDEGNAEDGKYARKTRGGLRRGLWRVHES